MLRSAPPPPRVAYSLPLGKHLSIPVCKMLAFPGLQVHSIGPVWTVTIADDHAPIFEQLKLGTKLIRHPNLSDPLDVQLDGDVHINCHALDPPITHVCVIGTLNQSIFERDKRLKACTGASAVEEPFGGGIINLRHVPLDRLTSVPGCDVGYGNIWADPCELVLSEDQRAGPVGEVPQRCIGRRF